MKFLALAAIGGAIGASGRYLVGTAALRLFGSGYPWGTLIVNIVGALLMGILIELMALKYSGSQELRIFLATGILGGFTTFSAFSLEVAMMIERGHWSEAGIYILASVTLTIAALFVGLYLVRSTYGVSL